MNFVYFFSHLHGQQIEQLRSASSSSSSPPPGQRRRTYLLSADQVESLKQRIFQQSKIANGQPSKPPSTYVAVSSLAWTCVVRAKSLSHADDAFFMLTADCRRRLRPPVDECFFGNCVTGCYARATVGDLCADAEGLSRAASAIENAIREQLEEPENPLTDIQRWFEFHTALPLDRLVAMGSSHRFKAYETDFGWGAPRRVELVSVFLREMVTLLGARDGGVQVSAALDRACMDAFAANFLRVAGGARQGSSAA